MPITLNQLSPFITPYSPAGMGARTAMQGFQGARAAEGLEERKRAARQQEMLAQAGLEQTTRADQESQALNEERLDFRRRKFAADVFSGAQPLMEGTPEQQAYARALLGMAGVDTVQGQDYVPRETPGMDRETDAAVAGALARLDAERGESSDPGGEGPVPYSAMPEEMRQRRQAQQQAPQQRPQEGEQKSLPESDMTFTEEEVYGDDGHIRDPRTGEPLTSEEDVRALEEAKEPVVQTSRPISEPSVEEQEPRTASHFEDVEKAYREQIEPTLETPEDATEVQMEEETVEGQAPGAGAPPLPGVAQSPMLAQASPQRRPQPGQQQGQPGQQGGPMRFVYQGEVLPGSYDPQAARQRKLDSMTQFYQNLVDSSSKRGVPAAEQAKALIEHAYGMTGDVQEANQLVLEMFDRRRQRDDAMRRKQIGARAAARRSSQPSGVPDSDYRQWHKLGATRVDEKVEKSQIYKDAVTVLSSAERLEPLLERISNPEPGDDPAMLMKTAEMLMIKMQQPSSKMSNKDVELGPVIESAFQKMANLISTTAVGDWNKKRKRAFYTALDTFRKTSRKMMRKEADKAAKEVQEFERQGIRPAIEGARQALRVHFGEFLPEYREGGRGRRGQRKKSDGGQEATVQGDGEDQQGSGDGDDEKLERLQKLNEDIRKRLEE